MSSNGSLRDLFVQDEVRILYPITGVEVATIVFSQFGQHLIVKPQAPFACVRRLRYAHNRFRKGFTRTDGALSSKFERMHQEISG